MEVALACLEDKGDKIDDPPGGSKDIADCLAAVVYHCEIGWAGLQGSKGMAQIGEMSPSHEPDVMPGAPMTDEQFYKMK